MKVFSVLALSLLTGCANYDPEQFQKGIQAAYLINQYQNQWQAPLNAQSYAALQAHQATVDRQWDWDEFYGQNGQLTWACRGVQSGRFADASYCNFIMKTDLRWPDKLLK